MFGLLEFFLEIGVLDCGFVHKVNVTAKQGFQGIVEIKIIVRIVLVSEVGIEVDEDIYITIIAESGGQNGAESIQLADPVLTAQGKELLYIVVDEVHRRVSGGRRGSRG